MECKNTFFFNMCDNYFWFFDKQKKEPLGLLYGFGDDLLSHKSMQYHRRDGA